MTARKSSRRSLPKRFVRSVVTWCGVHVTSSKPNAQLSQIAMVAIDEQECSVVASLELRATFSIKHAEETHLSRMGYSPDKWKNAVDQRKCVQLIRNFMVNNSGMLGSFSYFDTMFLRSYFDRARLGWPVKSTLSVEELAKSLSFATGNTSPIEILSLCRQFSIIPPKEKDLLDYVRAVAELGNALKLNIGGSDLLLKEAMSLGGAIPVKESVWVQPAIPIN